MACTEKIYKEFGHACSGAVTCRCPEDGMKTVTVIDCDGVKSTCYEGYDATGHYLACNGEHPSEVYFNDYTLMQATARRQLTSTTFNGLKACGYDQGKAFCGTLDHIDDNGDVEILKDGKLVRNAFHEVDIKPPDLFWTIFQKIDGRTMVSQYAENGKTLYFGIFAFLNSNGLVCTDTYWEEDRDMMFRESGFHCFSSNDDLYIPLRTYVKFTLDGMSQSEIGQKIHDALKEASYIRNIPPPPLPRKNIR